jgi:2,3-bisphosphoglycerate-independent phosphoglycerate mutase
MLSQKIMYSRSLTLYRLKSSLITFPHEDTNSMNQTSHPVVLCILDGWGYSEIKPDNAIAAAHKPTWDRLWQEWPHTLLQASENHVGLPMGQMGNSEVGHTNLGAGRIVYQDLPRIDKAIQDDHLQSNPHLKEFIKKLHASKGRCHLLGLLSPGGVHSHQNHIVELIKILSTASIPIIVHPFLDGRDTPPRSALSYMQDFLSSITSYPQVKVGTLSGRYYAMDRDNRWDRIEKAYDAMVNAKGISSTSPLEAIQQSYCNGIIDEFILPTVIKDYEGMHDDDGLLIANFRADRVRQLLNALIHPKFSAFVRPRHIHFASQVGMVEYSSTLKNYMTCLFPPIELYNVLGEIISHSGGKQLRIAETEKYAHVTFFFNGGREAPFPGEDRILVPSPQVATYDHQPEMSAVEVTKCLIKALNTKDYGFVVVNYANPDMVGHTGNQQATQKAIEVIDHCLAKLEKAILAKDGTLIITADHGNAEMMFDPTTGTSHTAHTCNPVPLILISKDYKEAHLHEGKLADVAPTILHILGLKDSTHAMTGICLLKNL